MEGVGEGGGERTKPRNTCFSNKNNGPVWEGMVGSESLTPTVNGTYLGAPPSLCP